MNYCKMYIDDEDDQVSIENIVGEGFANFFNFGSVYFSFFLNKSFVANPNISSSTYPVDRSRYYVELDADLGVDPDGVRFRSAVADLTIWLRKRFEYVVVSSDFEDYIVEKTGWNWTQE